MQHRKLTGFGVKPIGEVQWEFRYRWLYGFVEPQSETSWFMEFSHLDGACFEVALAHFAAQYPEDLHIIQVDNASAHHAQTLTLPDNVILSDYCDPIPLGHVEQCDRNHPVSSASGSHSYQFRIRQLNTELFLR